MTFIPDVAERLAKTGCNLSIDAKAWVPDILKRVVETCVGAGGTVAIRSASGLIPDVAESLAKMGGTRITLEI